MLFMSIKGLVQDYLWVLIRLVYFTGEFKLGSRLRKKNLYLSYLMVFSWDVVIG